MDNIVNFAVYILTLKLKEIGPPHGRKIKEERSDMAEEMPRKLHSTPTKANPKPKKLGIFSSTSRKDNLPATTQLMFPKDVQPQSPNPKKLHFKTEDKISILFKYKNYCIVQRKYDRTVAVLNNAVFKERNPPMLFDGTKLKTNPSSNIRIVLMYALAKTSYNDPEGIEFEKNDVILTLAARGEELLGITQSYKVGFFPSDLVLPITKRRLCFFEGMMLAVTAFGDYEAVTPKELSVRRGQDYEISKGQKGLFDWSSPNNLKVPLNCVAEKGIDVPAMTDDEGIYYTISEIKQPLTPLPNPLYDTHVSTLNPDWTDDNDTFSGKPKNNRSGTKQSTMDEVDLCKHPDEYNKEIEKQFRERLALDRTKQAPNVLPLPPVPRCNSIYMESNTSFIKSPRNMTTPTESSEISDEDYDTVKMGCGTVDHERTLYEGIPDDSETLRATTEQTDTKTKNKPNDKIQDLLNNVAGFRDVIVSEQVRCIVSEYVDEDVWDQLGRKVKVPKNKRREIANKEGSINAKTNELLGLWCERFGSDATVGFLLDALVEVNPEDLDLILEDLCKAFNDGALYSL